MEWHAEQLILNVPAYRAPAHFVFDVVSAFDRHADEIDTVQLEKGLTSDEALAVLRADLVALGFEVEAGKRGRVDQGRC